MALIPSVKQGQVRAGVTKSRSNAVKVHCAEAIIANDILVASGIHSPSNVISVVKAIANDITKCRGPFYVADYAAALGDITPVALPWKLVTSVATNGAAVGDTVWLSNSTAGQLVVGSVPNPTAKGAAFSLLLKMGRVVKVDAVDGAYLLEPGLASGSPLVGKVTLGGTSTTVIGLTAELDAAPVVVTPGGAHGTFTTAPTAAIASGTLTITHPTSTDVANYFIHA